MGQLARVNLHTPMHLFDSLVPNDVGPSGGWSRSLLIQLLWFLHEGWHQDSCTKMKCCPASVLDLAQFKLELSARIMPNRIPGVFLEATAPRFLITGFPFKVGLWLVVLLENAQLPYRWSTEKSVIRCCCLFFNRTRKFTPLRFVVLLFCLLHVDLHSKIPSANWRTEPPAKYHFHLARG